MSLTPLSQFAESTYSQFGEDGIVCEILKRIEGKVNLNKWCVDVGAYNGVDLSNTCKLIRELGFNAVLIEGDEKQIPVLKHNFPRGAVCVGEFVSIDGVNRLDEILKRTDVPINFDFLSLDIDGMDYWVWSSLVEYKPKIVCVEFNPTVPNAVEFINEPDFRVKHGSSALSFVKLAESKGYSLVASTKTNLFFVESQLSQLVIESPETLIELNLQGNDPQYIFSGYDGSILSNKNSVLLNWHFEFPLSKIQIFPKFLRIYRGDYGSFRKFVFSVFIALSEPSKIVRRIRKRLK